MNLAGDGKAIQSLGNPSKKKDNDKRREDAADWGVKKYQEVNEKGKHWEKLSHSLDFACIWLLMQMQNYPFGGPLVKLVVYILKLKI